MKRVTLLLALLAVSAAAIDIPRAGFVRDSQGRVTAINGIAGNFVSGDTQASDTVAFSWNGAYGLRKTGAAIEWWDASGTPVTTLEAGIGLSGGDAVIGLTSDPSIAFLYSKSVSALCQLRANPWRLQQVPVVLSDQEEVLGLTGGRDSVTIALRRAPSAGGEASLFLTTFDLSSGTRTAELPSARTASQVLFLNNGGALAGIDGSTIWITNPNGSEWTSDTGVSLSSLAWMGRDWIAVQAADGTQQFALRVRAGSDPQLYILPQAAIQ